MATTIFLILSGLGVMFLLYVLVKLWQDEHRPEGVHRSRAEARRGSRPEVIVVTHPVCTSAHGGVAVLPLQARSPEFDARSDRRSGNARILEMPVNPVLDGRRRTTQEA